MLPLPYTWAGLPFWIVYAWAFLGELPFLRRERTAQTAVTDRGSKRLILIVGGVSAFFAFFFAGTLRGLSITTGRVAAYVIGLACIAAGGWLRRHCFSMLGESFTYDVRVTPEQRVIECGAYRYVRHPSYSASLLMFGGIGLALGNWASLTIAIVPTALAYAYRISVEERALVDALGPAYGDYMKRTRRVIPFIL